MPAQVRYIPRELSWLAFNRRVLEEAQEKTNPLLERAKFLAIVASNLDEFVMVRLPELAGLARDPDGGGDTDQAEASRTLPLVRRTLARQVEDQYACWRDQVAPALEEAGLTVVAPRDWHPADRETLRKYYRDQLEPVLTPLAVDPGRPFPLVANRGLCVVVSLVPEGGGLPAAMQTRKFALVAVPAGPRLVALVERPGTFALMEDVVLTFLDHLFSGYQVVGRTLFRATRDGALDIDEADAPDLLAEIEQELSSRDHGQVVRLELEADADADLRAWLMERMHVDTEAVVSVDGPLDLTFLFSAAAKIPGRPDLQDPPLEPILMPSDEDWQDPWTLLRDGDVLLHHPYESFHRVVELIERAANDPQVLAIKQTLYRTSGTSPIVKSLMQAARSGKQVTVLMELKARFDEAANIRWARALEEAGAHVIYGLVGYKVHAKLCLIIRKDEDGIRRYCHLGTGNYNEKTARLYTDLSLLTANEAVGRDVAALFNVVTGYAQPPEWERLAVAPLTLRSQFVSWIQSETAHARAGRPARITAKFNALVDTAMCDELYAASQAGVRIDLIVRGMCILRPGVPGLSENITVRSIVGRFLEHSRIYRFENAGDPIFGIASADWMTRNLDRRVEHLVRIDDPVLQARLQAILDTCMADNVQARVMHADGIYARPTLRRGEVRRPSQVAQQEEARQRAQKPAVTMRAKPRFRPRRKGR
jgi:polyphosphate kinase